MTEVDELFAVLAVLYLLQCTHWIPEDSFALRQSVLGRWRVATAFVHLPAVRRKAVLGNPLPPLGSVLVCPPVDRLFPVTLAPDGVLLPGGSVVAIEQLTAIEVHGPALRASGKLLASFVSPPAARHFAHAVAGLAKRKRERREAEIDALLSAGFDTERVAQVWSEFREQAGMLRWHCHTLFFYISFLAPGIVWWRGLSLTWPFLLGALLLQMWMIAWLFRRAHRALYPEENDARFMATVTMVLSPVAAVRAVDELAQNLLSTFHPLPVVHCLCPRKRFQALTARALREAHFPLASESDDNPQTRWWDARWRAALKRFASEHFDDADTFLGTPPAQEGCRSYCPRCWSQYVVEQGTCADCGGLPLRGLQSPQ